MMKHNWPNLFIVGAMKSGTTTLHNVLSRHPQVFMSEKKEPHFFAFDGQRESYAGPEDERIAKSMMVLQESEYQSVFHGRNQNIQGESSAMYLYYTDRPEEFKNTTLMPRSLFY